MLTLLSDGHTPSTLPYHLIVPSLPGYAFSSGPPLDKDFRIDDVARILNRLVIGLGFEQGYVVQGGDIGSTIARVMAAEHASCKGEAAKWRLIKIQSFTDLPICILLTPGNIGAHENPKWYIKKPFGFSWFPKEIAPVPQSWAATTGNLVFFRQHTKGGHFAALERPDVLAKDIKDFIEQVWPQAQKA
ncbi:unnamed protein product [Adineta steineri]|uniref:AB hydrolase-1 domain-containing protein n=1 Tax=Adineta steineri TaxID=433720 RepID=A0A819TMZ7_9BILA|nr:unnamed protein product [Adineta steineri]